jgi:hypothetical protein
MYAFLLCRRILTDRVKFCSTLSNRLGTLFPLLPTWISRLKVFGSLEIKLLLSERQVKLPKLSLVVTDPEL